MVHQNIKFGDILIVKLPKQIPDGVEIDSKQNEEEKTRRVICICNPNDFGTPRFPGILLVAPLTSNIDNWKDKAKTLYPFFQAEDYDFFSKDNVLLLDQIRAIDKTRVGRIVSETSELFKFGLRILIKSIFDEPRKD
jgi:hypothetical protein